MFVFGTDALDVLAGTELADAIYGYKGRDALNGGDAADFISGGRGADEIVGAGGDDYLHGGRGKDVFAFGLAPGDGVDIILDFTPGKDTILVAGDAQPVSYESHTGLVSVGGTAIANIGEHRDFDAASDLMFFG